MNGILSFNGVVQTGLIGFTGLRFLLTSLATTIRVNC
jgi:hypothetical protein